MNSRQLQKLGVPEFCVKEAIQAVSEFAQSGSARARNVKQALKFVLAAPDEFVGDKYFGTLAKAIIDDRDFAPAEPIPVYTGHIRPAWSFSQDGPSCTHEGITVHFSSERNLANSRAICEQLMREVELLADEMAWQYRHAVSINWRGLSIAATPGGPEHMVQLNSAGDILLVSVPLLFSTPDLLPEIVPWVQQRLGGGQAVEVELEAGRYGWQDP